ncbi:substrate-binding domain-containing protein [Planktosalinus lacus]|uniref:ABC transporter substrate-binding protein n=1 Tax=Planktosalinus lacus TaxID=1526573 RepID=A0A8J2VA51_9FLAO|nr:substrate-binding domain-containing protein [Planktosalinus lacus]GGD93445.1 ABC transporter substrate-binding protein [Planktosalinus lacus]
MKKIKIGGVPEHFNYPWYLALKDKKFQQQGINLRWVDFLGGTGEMNNALREKEIDLAVILTEGIVKDIIQGNQSKIVQVFVKSPLVWGIHVAKNSPYQTISDLRGAEAAISRYGSGSHLMAFINAQNQHWDIQKDLKFKVIENLDGALKGLPNGEGDYFMWEKFTTKPYVDKGIFRRVGNCPTPWPCFVIAARDELIENDPEAIKTILELINAETKQFKEIPAIDHKLADRYQQKVEDIQEWLSLTQWSSKNLTSNELEEVQKSLLDLNLIDKKVAPERILFNF